MKHGKKCTEAAKLVDRATFYEMFYFPMVFMLAATLTSLVITVINKCKAIGAGTAAWGDWFQLFFATAMAVLAIFLVVEGAQTFAKQMKEKKVKKAA